MTKKAKIYSLVGLLLLSVVTKITAQKDTKKPNIIFLLTDDQRYDALGCMGNSEIQTPNIDRLGNEGVIFKNFYNTTSICMASRAQMMTGMYEYKTGCNFSHGPLSQDKFDKSYPKLLQQAGYKTGFTGKFGFAVRAEKDLSMKGASNYHSDDALPIDQFDWWKGWPGQGYYQTAKNKYMVEYATEFPHVSRALGASSRDFIREYANKKEPFCLSVSFKAPHSPVSPDPIYDNVYAGKSFKKHPNLGQKGGVHLPQQAKLGRQYMKLGKRWEGAAYDNAVAKYYQLIHAVDVAVGMILEEVEKQGIADNTIIIFTTDNGYSTGAHGFGGKVLPYEEGARGPLLIYAPGSKSIKKGWVSEALVGNIDMAPTILDFAGLPVPENMDGKSLVPLVEKKGASVKEDQAIIQAWGEDPTHSLTIVAGDYKYLYWFYGEGMQPKEELYNIKKDIYEMNNLANNTKYADKLKEMQGRYDAYVAKWKRDAVPTGNYPMYASLYDRHVSWDVKRELLQIDKKKQIALRKKKKEKALGITEADKIKAKKAKKAKQRAARKAKEKAKAEKLAAAANK
ncbi:MAG: sulfatase family protein [Flavicella sp.]